MIVGLDLQPAVGTATGAGVYARDLARALRAAGTTVRALRAPWLDPWRFDRRVIWDQALLPLAAAAQRIDVLHATAGTLPALRRQPVVVTVHDMAWLRVQSHTRAYARAYFGTAMRALYRAAAAVVVDSAFSAAEYAALAGDARTPLVVYPGVDERFARIVRVPDDAPLALVAGTVERRKNLLIAVEAAAAIPELRVVSVGPLTPYAREVRARAAELGIERRVELRGYVPTAEIDALYARATVALVPSRYEGFGYAVAEAACAGVPFIAARGSSLTEVAADAGRLADGDDAHAWIDALRELLAARSAADARAAAARDAAVARFAWATAARTMHGVYAAVARTQ